MLKNGDDIDNLLNAVPDEFYKWIREVIDRMNAKYAEILKQITSLCKAIRKYDRKKQAEYIKRHSEYPSVAFAMLDKNDPAPYIWKHLKPEKHVPYNQNELKE